MHNDEHAVLLVLGAPGRWRDLSPDEITALLLDPANRHLIRGIATEIHRCLQVPEQHGLDSVVDRIRRLQGWTQQLGPQRALPPDRDG